MKSIFLLGMCSLLLVACSGGNGGSNQASDPVTEFSALKAKKNRTVDEEFAMGNLALANNKAKAHGRRLHKLSVGDNVFPQEIREDDINELYIVNENGQEVPVNAWFKCDDPRVSITQALDGNHALITASEPGSYTIKAHVRKHPLDKHDMMNEYKEYNNFKNHKTVESILVVTANNQPPQICPNVVGAGTSANPYLVRNLQDLGCMFALQYVNNSANHIRLEADLDLRGRNTFLGWWSANLDGNGHKIYWDMDTALAPVWSCQVGQATCYDLAPFRVVQNATFKNLTFEIGNVTGLNWMNAGGVFGNAHQAVFENITVNYSGRVMSDNQRAGFGGFSSGANTYRNIVVNNFKVDGCSTIDGDSGISGGFLTYLGNSTVIENVQVNNATFENCDGTGVIGGFIGLGASPSVIKNSKVNGLTIQTKNATAGGFFGSSWANITAEDIQITNSNIQVSMENGQYGTITGLSDNADGIVSFKNVLIDNVHLRSSNVAQSLGIMNARGTLTLDGIQVSNSSSESVNLTTSSCSMTAGLVGNIDQTTSSLLKNISMLNVSLSNDCDFEWVPMSGVLGIANGDPGMHKIQDVVIKNMALTSAATDAYKHRMMAGVVAHSYDGSIDIENVKIDGLTLTSTFAALAGGVVGEVSLGAGDTSSISKAQVENLTMSFPQENNIPSSESWKKESRGGIYGRYGGVNGTQGSAAVSDVLVIGDQSIGYAYEVYPSITNSLFVATAPSAYCTVPTWTPVVGMNSYAIGCSDSNTVTISEMDRENQSVYGGFDFTATWVMDSVKRHPVLR